MNQRFLRGILIEFGPVSLFFIAYELWDFFSATIVLLGSTVLALCVAFILDRRVALFPLIAAFFTLLFGGATLFFNEPRYLVAEYTLYNGIFGLALIVGIFSGRGLLKYLFDSLFALTDRGWYVLSLRWGVFFSIVAFANEIVWANFSPDIWVAFRFASIIVFVAFGTYQFRLSRRERLPHASLWGMKL